MYNMCINKENISNGVRLGRKLSPKIFAVYVNNLFSRILKCNFGCNINDMIMYKSCTYW